jgi:CheY-like chemotaxis protein
MKNSSKRVMVVDDDTMIRHNVSELLRASGYIVSEMADGDGVAQIASVENPALIVMDIDMPRRDGFAALRDLREDPTTEQIPVLMLSAINDYELGANYDCTAIAAHTSVRAPEAFLEKPFEARHLLREVLATCA